MTKIRSAAHRAQIPNEKLRQPPGTRSLACNYPLGAAWRLVTLYPFVCDKVVRHSTFFHDNRRYDCDSYVDGARL